MGGAGGYPRNPRKVLCYRDGLVTGEGHVMCGLFPLCSHGHATVKIATGAVLLCKCLKSDLRQAITQNLTPAGHSTLNPQKYQEKPWIQRPAHIPCAPSHGPAPVQFLGSSTLPHPHNFTASPTYKGCQTPESSRSKRTHCL